MRHCVVVLFFLFASKMILAQNPVADTLSIPEPTFEPIVIDTTVQEFVILPSDLEYIPGDETPELLADRLSCLQREIPLTYNTTVHGFIDFFTVRNRDYTRLMQRRQDLYFPLFEKYLAQYNLPDELKYLVYNRIRIKCTRSFAGTSRWSMAIYVRNGSLF
jgi:membrane-bound lytic murein transglycosylase D